MAGDERTELELRIPVGTPETIDSGFLCRLGGQYLKLLERVAQEQGRELSFHGLRLEKGSTRALFATDNPESAQEAADEAAPYVSGEIEPPPGIASLARDVSNTLREGLGEHQVADVIIGPWKRPLAARPEEVRALSAETIALRVKVQRVGGVKPAIRVESAAEPFPFTLQVKPDDAPKLGARLYQEIDIVATVRRDDEERIVSGTLDEWEPLEEGGGVEAWREWFRKSAPEWEGVEDVSQALRTDEDDEDEPADDRH